MSRLQGFASEPTIGLVDGISVTLSTALLFDTLDRVNELLENQVISSI
jgi:hypothetical protein